MHDTALLAGLSFIQSYAKKGMIAIDIGGGDYNGSLRQFFKDQGVHYICIDIEQGKGVDMVIKPGERLPFADGAVSIVVSTSCFEHDPCFWMTFREMARITCQGGLIYVNAPSNGPYHKYPDDNWRFYSGASQALAHWSGKIIEGKSYPVKIEETFHIYPIKDVWVDFICVWKRVIEPEKEIVLSDELKEFEGPMRKKLKELGCTVDSCLFPNVRSFRPLEKPKTDEKLSHQSRFNLLLTPQL